MHRLLRIGTLIANGFVFVAIVASSEAAEPDPEFSAAKQTFFKEMKKKAPAARADAVTAFAKVPRAETIDLLLKRGLTDDSAPVQQATRSALRSIAEDTELSGHVLDELKKQTKKQNNIEVFGGLLSSLSTTANRQLQLELLKIVDDFLASPKRDLLVPMLVIDDLGQQGGPDAFRGISLLARAKVFTSEFGYRRCVVQAMSQLREPDAIGYLIDLVPQTQGLVQYDIIQHLTKTTKQKFRDNDREWSTWWKQNQADFKFPPAAADDDVAAMITDDKQPTYYGIPICAKRVLFVLDTSGSMRGQPMEAAKNALIMTVESLPEAISFDIIMFDRNVSAWYPRLVPATNQAKIEAAQTVLARGMSLGTASNAALTSAFELHPEVIYFLSDGEPTDGAPAAIVANISAINRTRRVSIHTIGVVTQQGGGVGLRNFMLPLAQRNYGSFRLIE